MMNDSKKSDLVKVAMKRTNKAGLGTAAESVERRTRAEGNTGQQRTHRTQCRVRVSQALERVRQAAKQRKEEKFTALLHHINVDLLRLSFYALKRQAAPGVDGATWQDYEVDLESSLASLHDRVPLVGASAHAGVSQGTSKTILPSPSSTPNLWKRSDMSAGAGADFR